MWGASVSVSLSLSLLHYAFRTDGGHNCVGSSKSYRTCNQQVYNHTRPLTRTCHRDGCVVEWHCCLPPCRSVLRDPKTSVSSSAPSLTGPTSRAKATTGCPTMEVQPLLPVNTQNHNTHMQLQYLHAHEHKHFQLPHAHTHTHKRTQSNYHHNAHCHTWTSTCTQAHIHASGQSLAQPQFLM